MPFDATKSEPTLENLSALLRDRSQWPEGFEWNYIALENCAIGLADRVWPAIVTDRRAKIGITADLAQTFGCTPNEARMIMAYAGHFNNFIPANEVTPEMVADAIDRIIEQREKRE
jgi:hypothetical protein